ncbi:MAG: methionyl-tRNA formyltransferase [Chloroflexota bacterium]|nr:MAG: methionyl-tRNA formyltransferase [Chloroflexota bacterium]
MGSDSFSLPVFSQLLNAGPHLPRPVETVAVVTQPDRPAGRGRKEIVNFVKALAIEHGLDVLQPQRLRDPNEQLALASLGPDVIVVASFGQILRTSLLELPRYRCLNLHPSLLPLYRGPSPVVGPLLAGDRVTGTSLMLMETAMDAGPLLGQVRTEIGDGETASHLLGRLAEMSGDLLIDRLPAWIDGEIVPQAQDEASATFTSKIRKEDGVVDWTLDAESIARRVRAYNPWPGAFTHWNGRQLRILEASPGAGRLAPGVVRGLTYSHLVVGTGRGLLLIWRLQIAGGKPLDARSFVHGHPSILGQQLHVEAPWS